MEGRRCIGEASTWGTRFTGPSGDEVTPTLDAATGKEI
jgi:hypothetical protein